METKVVLRCGSSDLPVTTRSSLVGRVSIGSSNDALAYARLFTSSDTYRAFDMDPAVEIVSVPMLRSDSAFNEVKAEDFRKAGLQPPSVRHAVKSGKSGYIVTRPVVRTDQRIYEWSEFIGSDGSYELMSSHVLVDEAWRLGVLFIGEI